MLKRGMEFLNWLLKVCVVMVMIESFEVGFGESYNSRRIEPRFVNINSELRPYVDQYLSLSGKKYNSMHIVRLTAGFGKIIKRNDGSTDDNDVARCRRDLKDGRSRREIIVGRDYWMGLNEDRRSELMLHEMGHCIGDRNHYPKTYKKRGNGWVVKCVENGKTLKDGCPWSIMYYHMLPGKCFKDNYFHYITELYTGERGWKSY